MGSVNACTILTTRSAAKSAAPIEESVCFMIVFVLLMINYLMYFGSESSGAENLSRNS